jgi:hypothetical protein
MSDATLPTEVTRLFDAVRRRLWAREFAWATRLAAWSWSVVFTVAAVLHAWRGWPGLGLTAAVGAAVAIALASFVLLRRPDRPQAAAFADRHLDGATAYSTLLESRLDASDATTREAVERLQRWAIGRVARSMSLLQDSRIGRQWPTRALAGALLTTGLAVVLVETAPTRGPARHASTSSIPDEAMPVGDRSLLDLLEPPDAADAAPETRATGAGAPRDTGLPAASDAVPASRIEASTPEAGTAVHRAAHASGADPSPAAPAPHATLTEQTVDASAVSDASTTAGRSAGTTRDPRRPGAGTDTSAASAVQWQAGAGNRSSSDARANAERVTTYLAEGHAWAAPPVVHVPAAAPPAGWLEAAPPSADAAYVDAWRRRLEDSR